MRRFDLHTSLPACLERPVEGTPWDPPIDVLDTTVRLETAGITDAVAKRMYGQPSVRALAEQCFASLEMAIVTEPPVSPQFSRIREYLHGTSFALPLLLCCLAMTFFDASLWGGDVSTNMAAAVGLGTVSSFIVTGGIVQATARRGLFLMGVAEHAAALTFCLKAARIGVLLLVTSGVAMLGMASFFGWLPGPFALAAVAFHLSLGLLWLSTGFLHMLERNLWSAAATGAGTAVVLLMYKVLHVELAVAQIAGILAAAAMAFCAAFILLRKPVRSKPGVAPRGSSLAFELYVTWPHIVFGVAYYLLVFSDRLLAWSVPDFGASSALQFRGDYETALDLALMGFILQIGNVRVSSVEFFHRLIEAQKHQLLLRRDAFIREITELYRRLSTRFVWVAFATSLLVYGLVSKTAVLSGGRTSETFVWALLGFSALVFALWNTSLLLRLSLTSDVLYSILPAIVLNLAGGYILTRLGDYHHAAIGFAAGAICFAVLSTRRVTRALSSIDYYYYASAT
jgi:hypothetical protein